MPYPKPLPKWFYTWARWRLGHGEFKRYGPANPLVRPDIPRVIPPWAWELFKKKFPAAKPKPLSNYIFDFNGGMAVRPNGGGPVEVMRDMGKNGYKWAAFQVFEGSEHGNRLFLDWSIWKHNAFINGMDSIPWARCRNLDDLKLLIDIGHMWGCHYILPNIEDEAWHNMEMAANKTVPVLKERWPHRVGISTVGFPPKGYGWELYNSINAVALMQTFRNENQRLTPSVCYQRGLDIGFNRVALTLGIYEVNGVKPHPSLYQEWNGKPRSLYTIDDLANASIWV